MAGHRAGEEHARSEDEAELRAEQRLAPVEDIQKGRSDQGARHEPEEPGKPDESDGRRGGSRGPRKTRHLDVGGDDRELVAGLGDQEARPQQPEVARCAKRRQVGRDVSRGAAHP